MLRNIKLCLLFTTFLFLNNCAGTFQSKTEYSLKENLSHQIELQISTPELETALVGIMVQSVETGEIQQIEIGRAHV